MKNIKDFFKTPNWHIALFFIISFILSFITCHQTYNHDAQLKQITFSLKRENFINSDSLIIKALKTENYAKRDSLLIIALKKPSYADRDSLLAVIKTKEFEEQYYLNQQGIQSDRIIMYVSLLFTMFGLLGYFSFFSRFDDLKQENKQKIEDLKKEDEQKFENLKQETLKRENKFQNEYEIQKKDLVKLQEGSYLISSNLYTVASETYGLREDFGKSFLYRFISARFFYLHYKIDKNNLKGIQDVTNALNEAKSILEDINKQFEFKNTENVDAINNNQNSMEEIFELLDGSKNLEIKGIILEIKIALKTFHAKSSTIDFV